MKKKLLGLAVVGMVGGAAVYLACHRGGAGTGILQISGNVEVTQTEVSFKIPGRVIERPVDEGQILKERQLVARLDPTELEQQVAARKADLDVAKAALAELEAGSRKEEIAQAMAVLDAAEADARRLKSDEGRQTELFKKEVISQREYDASHTAWVTSQARVSEAEQRYTLIKKGPRLETIAQARAKAEAATQALALAQTQLSYATLSVPVGGVVLSKNVEPGEVVAAGTPVITIGDLRDVWMRAYIDETDLGRVKVGQRAWLTTDTYPGKRYEGSVVFISPEAEFTPKSVQTKKERVKLVYRIKIDVPNPSMELKPGMPADASIEIAQ